MYRCVYIIYYTPTYTYICIYHKYTYTYICIHNIYYAYTYAYLCIHYILYIYICIYMHICINNTYTYIYVHILYTIRLWGRFNLRYSHCAPSLLLIKSDLSPHYLLTSFPPLPLPLWARASMGGSPQIYPEAGTRLGNLPGSGPPRALETGGESLVPRLRGGPDLGPEREAAVAQGDLVPPLIIRCN
jgi:hypothetical protein